MELQSKEFSAGEKPQFIVPNFCSSQIGFPSRHRQSRRESVRQMNWAKSKLQSTIAGTLDKQTAIYTHAKTTKKFYKTPKQLNYSYDKDLQSLTLCVPLELCEESHENMQKEMTKFSNSEKPVNTNAARFCISKNRRLVLCHFTFSMQTRFFTQIISSYKMKIISFWMAAFFAFFHRF